MGKLGRFFCILTPMLCTLLSLLCCLIVMIGGTNKSNHTATDLWFLKLDTRYITEPNLASTNSSDTGSKKLGLADFYTIALWDYCSGDYKSENGADVWTTTYCGKPSAQFYFDSIQVLGLQEGNGIIESKFPKAIVDVNKGIKAASNFMTAMYLCGLVATVLTFCVGWFGLLSRWGSCVTTLIADVACIFFFIASAIASALFVSLKEGYNKSFQEFGVKAYVSNQMLSITWLTVAFSLAAAVFWMFSTCCCSGRSDKIMGRHESRRGKGFQKAPYSYDRVPSPYGQETGSNVPMSSFAHAKGEVGYEPYRHSVGR